MDETYGLGVLLAAMVGSFSAGVLNAWAWLLPMTPESRDAFLRGVADGISPAFWLRKITGKS